jgi:hypothetical protein
MTKPQDQLVSLAERIRHLSDLFEWDENGNNIFDTIRGVDKHMTNIMNSLKRQEEMMNVIIKLLSKDENSRAN